MGKDESAALKRLGRGIFSLVISGATAFLTGKPYLIAATPIINALGKWLRQKFNLTTIPF